WLRTNKSILLIMYTQFYRETIIRPLLYFNSFSSSSSSVPGEVFISDSVVNWVGRPVLVLELPLEDFFLVGVWNANSVKVLKNPKTKTQSSSQKYSPNCTLH